MVYKKIINDAVLQGEHTKIHFLRSSCSSWLIYLMVSSLWIAQASPLRATDKEEPGEFYKDAKHPLTQSFWQKTDLSDRLKQIQFHISKMKSINFSESDLAAYKVILNCVQGDVPPVRGLEDIEYHDLLIHLDDAEEITSGYSGAKVKILANDRFTVVIKKIHKIEEGLRELLYSLVALDINPSPQEIKMTRIYDAVLYPGNCLSIIMEGANGYDIPHFLSTKSATNAVKACAEYLATFHLRNYQQLTKSTNRQKYINHVSKAFHTLSQNPLKEEERIELLSLSVGREFPELEDVTSNNVIRLLSQKKQERFVRFVEKLCRNFEKNCEEIYRSFKTGALVNQEFYFLTRTHGDAHGNNFFYNDANDLLYNGSPISKDSFYRITMIDFASIIRTYDNIGDPTDDVGRFLGSLWSWGALQNGRKLENYNRICSLQKEFLQTYLQKIRTNPIFTEKDQKHFEEIFRENYNFYKLRFYRAIFNAKKDKIRNETKKKILKSWIRENSALEFSSQQKPKKIIVREKSEVRLWKPACTSQEEIIHRLPEQSEVFIENFAKEPDESYLTCLWKMLEDKGNVTLSSTIAIAGMGGVGKTSLALEYAHEALKNNAYNVIYWLQSGSKASLLKGYKNFLLEMGVPDTEIKRKDDESIIKLIKQELAKPERRKYLLIYDNVPLSYNDVPSPIFLKGKIPENQNTHTLITSRSSDGFTTALNLDVFRMEDSRKYLLTTTELDPTPENEKLAEDLAEALGHLPLALAHAAYYIRLVGGEDVSLLRDAFEKYLKDFTKDEPINCLENLEKNKHPFKHPELGITYNNLIGRTLSMSMSLGNEYLSELAKKLIVYASYLDPDAIPEDIFLECWQDQEKLEKALKQLSSLSLIKRTQNGSFFSIHRLVQLVMRNEKEAKEDQQCEEAFSHLVPAFTTFFKKNVYNQEQIDKSLNNFPHIQQFLTHSQRLKISCQGDKALERLEWIGKFLYFIFLLADDQPRFFTSPQEDITKKSPGEKNNEKKEIFLKKVLSIFKSSIKTSKMDPIKASQNREALSIWLANIVERANSTIQFVLATLYTMNLLVDKNDDQAFYWYTKAASRGHVRAQNDFGAFLRDTTGQHHNYKHAFKWFMRAAKQGHTEAYNALTHMYIHGLGVENSDKEAFYWSIESAKKKNEVGIANVGMLYFLGKGVGENIAKGIKYLTEAAEQGHSGAQFHLGQIYLANEKVERDSNKAIKWLTKSAEQKYEGACLLLGKIYCGGAGVDQDYRKGFEWLTKAAEQGQEEAKFLLSHLPFEEEEWEEEELQVNGVDKHS